MFKVGYVLTDERITSGTPRFRFYNPKKYFPKNIQAEVYQEGKQYDVVIFTKRFTEEDIVLANKLDCVKVFDINDNFFEVSSYSTDTMVNNCIEMATVCDAVTSPSRYILGKAKQYNPTTIWIPDFIDEVEETPLRVCWHGLASNAKQLTHYMDLFKELGIEVKACADWKTNPKQTKQLKEEYSDAVEFIEWETEKVYKTIEECDILFSPKLMDQPQWENGKGFNKLVYGIRKGKKCVAINIREYQQLHQEFPDLICLYDNDEGLRRILERKIRKKKDRQTKYSSEISVMWENVFKSLKVPTVSIITAVYNGAQTIAKTIDSVISQTFDDWEYIIVDDCSTDSTSRVLQEAMDTDPRIKVYKNDRNLKQAKSRNKAIKMSRGKYIANIDADDIMEVDRLELQVEFMRKEKCDVCYGGYTAFDMEIENKHSPTLPRSFDTEVFLNKQNLINNSTVMMKRGIFFDERWNFAEDYSTWICKYKVGGKLSPLNKNLIYFRLCSNSNSFRDGNLQRQIDERDSIIKYWQGFNIEVPKVSIIMPTYNRPKIIYKSIESVLAQSFQEWELIVVNDGGKSIKKVIDSYNDKRIKYFEKKNGGLSSALNYGIEKATSEFIALLDDDDLWEPTHLELTVGELNKGNVDIVYTNCTRINGKGQYISTYNIPFNQEMLMFEKNLLTTCSTVFKKEVWRRCNGFDETLATHMDWDMWKKAVKNGFCFKQLPVVTSYYVVHGQNMLADKHSIQNEKDKNIVLRR